jgi:hypothetical protein
VTDDEEIAYTVIEPHFDAVRDTFADRIVAPSERMGLLRRTKLVVDRSSVRDSERHYAKCRDDGLLILMAPEAADLEVDTLVALICHEFGHAADFLYPGRWLWRRDEAAIWLPGDTKKMGSIRRAWAERTDDQVEWAADSIARAITGRTIGYCGECMVQCFSGGKSRPGGLR